MHELGYVDGILEAVEHRAAGRRVQRIRLRIGVVHRIDLDALTQSFALVAGGTVAEDATIELVDVPMVVECRTCRTRSPAVDPLSACPACRSEDVTRSGGDEIVLESITLALGSG